MALETIPQDQLIHRAYYRGWNRNTKFARWDATQNCFVFWRAKFDSVYISTAPHGENAYQGDIFRPWAQVSDEEITFPVPFYAEGDTDPEPTAQAMHEEDVRQFKLENPDVIMDPYGMSK